MLWKLGRLYFPASTAAGAFYGWHNIQLKNLERDSIAGKIFGSSIGFMTGTILAPTVAISELMKVRLKATYEFAPRDQPLAIDILPKKKIKPQLIPVV